MALQQPPLKQELSGTGILVQLTLMNISEKIDRSKRTDLIDFCKYQSIDANSPIVKITNEVNIAVEPYWTLEDDWEGIRYAAYISDHPHYDGIYLRKEVAERLKNAAANLPPDLQLVIRAGHRPIEVQKKILHDCAQDYKNTNPGVSDHEALEHAREFISDPDISLPPHVCAAAVDVELRHISSGKLLDFGSKINDDIPKSYLHHKGLTEVEKNNRMILLTAMLSAGFASCQQEWWHFSYGDQVWAWFYGHKNSLYSPVDV